MKSTYTDRYARPTRQRSFFRHDPQPEARIRVLRYSYWITRPEQGPFDASWERIITVRIERGASDTSIINSLTEQGYILDSRWRCGHERDCCGCAFPSVTRVVQSKRHGRELVVVQSGAWNY